MEYYDRWCSHPPFWDFVTLGRSMSNPAVSCMADNETHPIMAEAVPPGADVVDLDSDEEEGQLGTTSSIPCKRSRQSSGVQQMQNGSILQEPPRPDVPGVITLTTALLPAHDRISYIKKFWEMRRDRHYFTLRNVLNLKQRAVEAVEMILGMQGKTPEVQNLDRIFWCTYYLWPGKSVTGR
ncbi:unnamed protein product, partial [Allacma fusca]